MTLGLGITTFMFVFTYIPQAAVMAFTSGPLAAITAALLVLSESSTLFTIFSKTFLIDDALVDTFDGVLLSKNTTDLVSEGRQVKAGGDPIAKLGTLVKSPLAKFTPKAMIRYVMYLPLNFIPVVGTVIFVLLQGKRAGPMAHTRYFQLKRWNKDQQQKHIEQYRGAYTGYTAWARWESPANAWADSEWLLSYWSSSLWLRSFSRSPTLWERPCGPRISRSSISRKRAQHQDLESKPRRQSNHVESILIVHILGTICHLTSQGLFHEFQAMASVATFLGSRSAYLVPYPACLPGSVHSLW